MENKAGVISEGAFADLLFVDLNSISLFSNNDIIASLCCSANGSEISSVMIGGKFVMKNSVLQLSIQNGFTTRYSVLLTNIYKEEK